MTRTTRCRYCAAPLEQTTGAGRPRQFCSDGHRRLHAKLMQSLEPSCRPPLGAPLFHSAEDEQRLRALHAELQSIADRCYTVANELELRGDLIDCAAFAAVGADLERSLAMHLEERP